MSETTLQQMGVNIAFSGAGFLGIYHVGVASCLKFYGQKLLDDVKFFGGSSAGALSACMLLCDIDLEESVEFVMRTAARVNSKTLGPMSLSFDPSATIRKTFLTNLPTDGYKRASGKLHISLTRVSDWKNEIVSEFASNNELVDALICSSFVPFFSGVIPPKFKGKHYIDGGFTDNLPQHFEGTTITVSPFSGESDICPDDGHKTNVQFDLHNTSIQITGHNIYRMTRAFFPPDSEELVQMCRQGFRDALSYLHINYHNHLDIGVNIVSIPQCCDFVYHKDSSDDDFQSVCSCDTSSKDSFFSDMETYIAQNSVLNSLVFPEQLNVILQKTKDVIHESDIWWYLIQAFLRLSKWLMKPYIYLSQHIHLYIEQLFQYILPKIKSMSAHCWYTKQLLEFIFEVHHAYRGTSEFEWHPSLQEDRHSDIRKTNKRMLTIQKSLVAMPRLSVTSFSSDLSRLGHEAPPPSRVSSFVQNDLGSRIIFDKFESESSTDNEVDLNTNTNFISEMTCQSSYNGILPEDEELLLKDDDGLVLKMDYLKSQPFNNADTDDYGSDLDYKFLSSESYFHAAAGESEGNSDDIEEFILV